MKGAVKEQAAGVIQALPGQGSYDLATSSMTRWPTAISFACPVCEYAMDAPAADYNICSSCGTEFGFDDRSLSHADLRQEWIARGRRRFYDDEGGGVGGCN